MTERVSQPTAAHAERAGWLNRLSPTARLLITCRGVRSLGQGALVVDFALYLHALDWSAVQIGAVYMGGLILGAALTLVAGPVSDSVGRKPFLIAYELALAVAGLIALLTADPYWLGAAAMVGAFGRGANGAAGPFGPVEQAWLSDGLADGDFAPVYSLNTAVGFGGMAAGALLASLPSVWAGWLPGPLRYRPLFVLVLAGALATLVLVSWMTETRGARAAALPPQAAPAAERRREHGWLLRLMGINALNGLAIGVIGPFMALWFHLRFGVGPATIGPVIALGFLLSSAAALWTGWLTRWLGTALSVVVMRFAGLVLLALLPFMPSYALAAACYVLRAACNRSTAGARQVVGLKLVGPARRGLAASLNSISMQVPRAFGPIIGGALLDVGLLTLPMLIAVALQGAYLALYATAFRRFG